MVATRGDAMLELVVVGVRRSGAPDLVTPADRFHIGSDAKAMTATMLATLVEKGKLGWDTTPSAVFPEAKDRILPDYRDVTLTDLLAHRAGLPAYDDSDGPEFRQLTSFSGNPLE
jgi:CubicO group peptidase (beta-lactamase class C family)